MPLTSPSISVIIPTHNGEKFILETLSSILEQSWPPNEIIVSDDGSSDSTVALVESLEDQTSGVVRLVTTCTDGISNNYLNALKNTSCDLIIVGDHDDVWQPDKIQIIANEFTKDSALAILSSDSKVVDENLNPLGTTLRGGVAVSKKLSTLCLENDFQQFLKGLRLDAHTLAFRASLKQLVFSEPFSSIDQFWFENKIAIAGMATGKLIYLADELTLYRQHATQHIGATSRENNRNEDKTEQSRGANLKLLLSLLKDKHLPNRLLSAEETARRAEMLEDYLAFVRARDSTTKNFSQLSLLLNNFVHGRYRSFTRRSMLSFGKDMLRFFSR